VAIDARATTLRALDRGPEGAAWPQFRFGAMHSTCSSPRWAHLSGWRSKAAGLGRSTHRDLTLPGTPLT
jgi:hypothetical protein